MRKKPCSQQGVGERALRGGENHSNCFSISPLGCDTCAEELSRGVTRNNINNCSQLNYRGWFYWVNESQRDDISFMRIELA
jgi:hypothetical protein